MNKKAFKQLLKSIDEVPELRAPDSYEKKAMECRNEIAQAIFAPGVGSEQMEKVEIQVIVKYLREAVEAERERNAQAADKWGRDRGMQFGCDGSPERSGARHHGIGTKDCPRELHHHHDERCQSPGDAIREQGKK